MRRPAFAFFLLCLYLPALSAQGVPDQEQAQAYYRDGQYEQAVRVYEGLLEQGYRDARLYYNLGNAYYRLDRRGEAVLAYERARRLDPSDTDIRHNLELIRARMPEPVNPVPAFFLKRWWESLRDAASPTTWGIVVVVLLWLGVGGMTLWLRGASRSHRKWGFVCGVIFLAGSLLPFFLAADRQANLRRSGQAVVMTGEIRLRSAPEETSQSVRNLYEGMVLDLLDVIGDWYKVRLADGEQGWVQMSAVEEI